MAKQSLSKVAAEGTVVLHVMVMLVVLVTGSLAVVEGVTVVVENDLAQQIEISCHSMNGDVGTRVVSPGLSYFINIPGPPYQGLKYTCTFVAAQKPTTTLDVFVGLLGVGNSPCNCLGTYCPWKISNSGFTCNFNTFTHNWGN